jgi:hypothetical protein
MAAALYTGLLPGAEPQKTHTFMGAALFKFNALCRARYRLPTYLETAILRRWLTEKAQLLHQKLP